MAIAQRCGTGAEMEHFGKPTDSLDLTKSPSPLWLEEILTAEAGARELGLSVKTLQKWRLIGGGPIYVKIGRRVGYIRRDLIAWRDARRRTSTSDNGPIPEHNCGASNGNRRQPVES
jgi:hypothetical protein